MEKYDERIEILQKVIALETLLTFSYLLQKKEKERLAFWR
jgi:hypothetical protein